MAKKVAPKNNQPKAKGLSDTQRWAYGFILLFFALFLLVSVVSYYFFWADDQSIAVWGSIFNGSDIQALNKGGKLGAVLGNYIVGQWFGVFGICIPIIFIILALRIMRYRPVYLRKSVRLSLILMILGSVSLGYLFGEHWGVFGTGLGGAHGVLIARWLNSVLGVFGTGLLLLLAIVIYAVYINRNTIFFINKVGKGIVDNSKKVSEVVTSTASNIIHHDAVSSDASPNETVAEDKSVSRTSEDKKSRNSNVDDDGFTIVDRSGNFEGFDDDDEEDAPQGEIHVDDDGFIITNLSPDTSLPTSVSEEQYGDKEDDGFICEDDGEFTVVTARGEEEQQPFEGFSESVEDGFVANVPQNVELEDHDNNEITIARLPEDKLIEAEDIENSIYDPTLELSTYQLPPVELLEDHSVEVSVTSEEIVENKNRIKETLENFSIKIDKIKATIGPTVTLYEIVPAPGVRISKIKNLEDDIALSLSALGIRIIAPIPGKGTIGIEVPNKDKKVVSMYSVIRSVKFQESKFDIPVVLGKTIQDETFVIDLAKMPHLLVAGATGQGKSVGLNAIITSLLYKKHPSELKLVLVDPKKVELTLYSKLERHFLAKMPGEDDAIITDTHKVIYTLNSLCIEMDARYDLLRKAEVRHIKEYNEKFTHRRLNPNKGHRFLPYIVVIIDEFADLIMTAGREIETPIARLAQLARAVGIHLVIATQRPTTNIITGVIKANFPARIAFRVTSMIDSRTIIDQPGANQLIGRGDMLVSTGNELIRVQCAFVDTPEIERITEFIGNQRGYTGAYELPEYNPEGSNDSVSGKADMSQLDDMFEEVARFVVQNQQGSTSSIQRRFSIGYNRAGRIMDQLENAGIVGSASGSKPREVLITDMVSLEMLLTSLKGY